MIDPITTILLATVVGCWCWSLAYDRGYKKGSIISDDTVDQWMNERDEYRYRIMELEHYLSKYRRSNKRLKRRIERGYE